MSTVSKAREWIRNDLFYRLLKSMGYDEKFNFESCEVTKEDSNIDNWASNIYYMDIILKQRKERVCIHFVIKLMDEDLKARDFLYSKEKFTNEIHFYSAALPLVMSRIQSGAVRRELQSLFASCYYTHFTDSIESPDVGDGVVVMENLKYLGFTLGNRDFLDLKHLTLAVNCLGSFHAASYFMKEKHGNEFQARVISPVLKTMLKSDNVKRCRSIFNVSSDRIVQELSNELPECHQGLRWLKNVTDDPYTALQNLVEAREPLAVLCHGDFIRNNIVFRYDDSGSPISLKMIDFQTIQYASPSIDLSALLMVNAKQETRREHLNTLLRVYHSSVIRTLSRLLEEEEFEVKKRYAYDALLADFQEHALYGYFWASMIVPFMLAEEDELEEISKLLKEELCSPAYNAKSTTLGGRRVNTVLVSVAKDLLEMCFPASEHDDDNF